MRRWLDNLEQFAVDVILERRFGKKAAVFRWFLYGLSKIYLLIVQLRIWMYQKRILRDRQMGCPVISIGNITVGGTGKTPVVEKFARELQDRGRKVAILSRGYKSRRPPLLKRIKMRLTGESNPAIPRIVSDGKALLMESREAGDEPYMLAKNLKDVIVISEKDRVKSGLYAINKFKVDTLLLDDGYQHLRLNHRLDIVLVDRQAPFGNGYLLPRGTLREPPQNLKRARYIFITKADPDGNEDLIQKIRKYNRTAEIIECTHKPLYLQNLYSDERLPLEYLKDRYVGSVCAIAAPGSFEGALRELGANLEIAKQFADHHRFSAQELEGFIRRCIRRDLDAIITTEKDAVRFPKLQDLELPVYFLRVEIEIHKGHENWEKCVDRICETKPLIAPERLF